MWIWHEPQLDTGVEGLLSLSHSLWVCVPSPVPAGRRVQSCAKPQVSAYPGLSHTKLCRHIGVVSWETEWLETDVLRPMRHNIPPAWPTESFLQDSLPNKKGKLCLQTTGDWVPKGKVTGIPSQKLQKAVSQIWWTSAFGESEPPSAWDELFQLQTELMK